MNCNVPENVIDKKLYCRVKQDIKKKVKVFPSAYASGLIVQEYKKRGGRYKGKKDGELKRWFDEKWINVCSNDRKPCGRQQSNVSQYPYCRPTKRISKKTPMTVDEMTKKYGKDKIEKMCKKKQSKGLPKNKKPVRINM
jgi:hypothetical protein